MISFVLGARGALLLALALGCAAAGVAKGGSDLKAVERVWQLVVERGGELVSGYRGFAAPRVAHACCLALQPRPDDRL